MSVVCCIIKSLYMIDFLSIDWSGSMVGSISYMSNFMEGVRDMMDSTMSPLPTDGSSIVSGEFNMNSYILSFKSWWVVKNCPMLCFDL